MIRPVPAWRLNDYIEAVVDQREYQRLGGTCWRNPFSCYMCHVVDTLLRQHRGKGISDARILDATYGEGRFWQACRRSIGFLAGVDIYDRKKIVDPDVFVKGDAVSKNTVDALARYAPFDAIVVDPPFPTGVTTTYRIPANHANTWQWERIIRNIDTLAQLLDKNGILLVKGMVKTTNTGMVHETTPYFIAECSKKLRLMHILHYRILHRHRTTTKNLVYTNYVYIAVLLKR